MKTNESNVDRIIRVVLGVLLLVLGFGGFVGGTFGLVLMIVGSLSLITGVIGWCPIYAILKFKTTKS